MRSMDIVSIVLVIFSCVALTVWFNLRSRRKVKEYKAIIIALTRESTERGMDINRMVLWMLKEKIDVPDFLVDEVQDTQALTEQVRNKLSDFKNRDRKGSE